MTDPRLPVRAMDGAHFSTVDEDGTVREWVRYRGAWVPLLVDADTFERIAAGEPVYELHPLAHVRLDRWEQIR